MEELNSIPETYRIHLTSPHPWDPSTVQLSSTESVPHHNLPQNISELRNVNSSVYDQSRNFACELAET